MKKSLLNLAFGGLAMLSMASIANAQTLTLDWKYTEDLPTYNECRSAVGADGKVWAHDRLNLKLMYWDENGKHFFEGPNGETLGASGMAITIDDAGNIIMNGGSQWTPSSTEYKILPAGGDALIDLNVALPEGVVAARMDVIGRAIGNIMSEEGGAFYIMPSGANKVAKIFVANGEQVVDKTESSAQTISVGDIETVDNMTYVQPLDNDINGWNVVWRYSQGKEFCYWQDGETKMFESVGATTTPGGDAVVLNGVIYTFEPTGKSFTDGFQVVDRSTNTVVATHEEECEAVSAAVNSLTVEKVDEYTANVYQMPPSRMVAKYTFSLPKPLPKLEARNAYAYDIKVEEKEDSYEVSYRLNAPASEVKVQLWTNGEVFKEFAGTTIAEYADINRESVNNLNTLSIPVSEMPTGTTVSFRIAVTSEALTEPAVSEKAYRFYHPAGVDIDNNPDSPYFGRLYVTEAMPSPSATYHSFGEGNGQAVYVFDQMLNPVKNDAGTYGFHGGQTFQKTFTSGSTSYEPRKVRISDDGRIFVSGQNENGIALWEMNPDDLNADFKAVMQGSINDQYEILTSDGEFLAGPNVSFDVKGENENLKIVMLSTNNSGISFNSTGYRTNEYDLGTATTWTTAPSRAIEGLSHKYTVTHTNTSVVYDNDGGIWYVNSRAEATDAQPALVHINAEGVEDYKLADGSNTYYGGGGIRFNKDFTRVAIAQGSTIAIFSVSKDTEGKPVLTQEYTFSSTIGRNCNDMAWDIADNLYIVGNSGEWLKAFSLPRENGEVVIAAASKYDVTIGRTIPENLYLIGSVNGLEWDPTQGELMTNEGDGVFSTQIIDGTAGATFGFSSVLAENNDNGGWDYVNANRYGAVADNTPVVIGEENAIYQNAFAFNLPKSGTYNLTVNIAKMSMTVEYVEPENPEALYLFGTITETDQWVPTTNVELTNNGNDVYTAEDVKIFVSSDEGETYGYIAFTATPSEDWNVVNATRYGPAVTNTELVSETAIEIGRNGDTSYKIVPGTYDVTVDLKANTVTVVEKGSGVEQVINAVAVIGGNGNIRIVGEAQSVSVYNVNGQAVVLNSAERSFDVAAGIYVVVVDGKTTKVMVK